MARTDREIGRFLVPAVVDTTTVERGWRYSGWRVVVTERADPAMVQYLAHLVRS